jgi:hypothetical protein
MLVEAIDTAVVRGLARGTLQQKATQGGIVHPTTVTARIAESKEILGHLLVIPQRRGLTMGIAAISGLLASSWHDGRICGVGAMKVQSLLIELSVRLCLEMARDFLGHYWVKAIVEYSITTGIFELFSH